MRPALLVALVALTSWHGVLGEPAAWQITPNAIASPAPPHSAQPQLSVSSRGVLLSWIERAGDLATLRFAERTRAGWTEPRTVASGRDWFVNWADVPSVIRLPSGTLAAHWLQKSGPDTYAYDVRLSYSGDDGKTWAPSFLPHHDNAKAEHGFASLFPIADGLGLVWLDGRAMGGAAGHDAHAADAGAMSVRYAQFDKDWKQVVDTQVDGRVCECCPTTAVATADGVIAAFRNRSEAEIRDIHVARMQNGKWSDSVPVFPDNWKIAACPVNGPSLSANGAAVAIAWFTATGDQGRAFAAFSQDAGRTFGAPIRLDEAGTLGRVDMDLLPDGAALATWIEFADQRAQIRARRIDRSGALSAPITIAGIAGSRASGYPRTAISGREAVFAWTESGAGNTLQVRTAAAGLP
ncbi:MAG: sialidase family protein [Vicinamibacterales bacterium]